MKNQDPAAQERKMEWMSRSQYSLRIPFELSQGITALRLPIGLKRSIAELVFQFAANVRGKLKSLRGGELRPLAPPLAGVAERN